MVTLCGCYYIVWSRGHSVSEYLPRVNVSAHTTILSTASKTVLSQDFINPSLSGDVSECKYVFPLYNGVSVVGFNCHVGSRIISGVVEEKVRAREVYDEAKSHGEVRCSVLIAWSYQGLDIYPAYPKHSMSASRALSIGVLVYLTCLFILRYNIRCKSSNT